MKFWTVKYEQELVRYEKSLKRREFLAAHSEKIAVVTIVTLLSVASYVAIINM